MATRQYDLGGGLWVYENGELQFDLGFGNFLNETSRVPRRSRQYDLGWGDFVYEDDRIQFDLGRGLFINHSVNRGGRFENATLVGRGTVGSSIPGGHLAAATLRARGRIAAGGSLDDADCDATGVVGAAPIVGTFSQVLGECLTSNPVSGNGPRVTARANDGASITLAAASVTSQEFVADCRLSATGVVINTNPGGLLQPLLYNLAGSVVVVGGGSGTVGDASVVGAGAPLADLTGTLSITLDPLTGLLRGVRVATGTLNVTLDDVGIHSAPPPLISPEREVGWYWGFDPYAPQPKKKKRRRKPRRKQWLTRNNW